MGHYVVVEPGVKIYVEELGSGKPVVLIHGWPVNCKMFEYQTNILPKHGYRCISIDLRGYGRSDAPWDGYNYDRMADDIYEVIKSLNLECDATLVGFSMGGGIAVRYMSRYKGYKINKLLLCGAAAPSFVQRPGFPYGMTTEAVQQFIAGAYTDRPQLLTQFGNMFFHKPVTPAFSDWFRSLGFDASSHGTIGGLEALRDEDLRNDLTQIATPTYIFHGIHDQVCPFPLAIAMHQAITGSILLRFDESGHGLFYDELDTFNARLLDVLRF